MEIKLTEVKIRDLVKDFKDDGDFGVRGFGGKLDIRPPYQRAFVYDPPEQKAVIQTVRSGFPLNVMYWATKDDGTFEVMDGQQRTMSIAKFVAAEDLSIDTPNGVRWFENLPKDEREAILDYTLMVYICTGTDSEKLDWFRTVNIAGLKLTDQELRNAVYAGPWVTQARRYFSTVGGPAFQVGGKYLTGEVDRQKYLETVIKWISKGKIEEYMAQHQHQAHANDLVGYFESVIAWVKRTFPHYRKVMQGIDWGKLYDEHKDDNVDPEKLEEQIVALLSDELVDSKKGVYTYVLDKQSNQEKRSKVLNLRGFDDKVRIARYEQQKGICPHCKDHFAYSEMEADHITPWHLGGRTDIENCQMLCMNCNRTKGGR